MNVSPSRYPHGLLNEFSDPYLSQRGTGKDITSSPAHEIMC